jgi:hypothetical protein
MPKELLKFFEKKGSVYLFVTMLFVKMPRLKIVLN